MMMDFNIPHTLIDTSPRRKVNKETEALNDRPVEHNRYLKNIPSKNQQNKHYFQLHMECTPGLITG